MSEWIQATPQGLLLRIVVQPRASRSEKVGPHGTPPRMKIRIAAPPVDGDANEEVIAFVAQEFGVPKSRVSLVRGATSKQKDVLVAGFTAERIPPGW